MEPVGGVAAGSLALISEVLHKFSDDVFEFAKSPALAAGLKAEN